MRFVLLRLLPLLLALLVGAVVAVPFVLDTPRGWQWIERMVAKHTPAEITGLQGPLWATPTVAQVRVSDDDGVWLQADSVALQWKPLRLLRMKPPLEAFDMERLVMLRAPVYAGEVDEPDEQRGELQRWLVWLPGTVRIGHVEVPGGEGAVEARIGDTIAATLRFSSPNLQALGAPWGVALPEGVSASIGLGLDGPLDAMGISGTLQVARPDASLTTVIVGVADVMAPSISATATGRLETRLEGRLLPFEFTVRGEASELFAHLEHFSLTGPGTKAEGVAAWQGGDAMRAFVRADVNSTDLRPLLALAAPGMGGALSVNVSATWVPGDVEAVADIRRLRVLNDGEAMASVQPVRITLADGVLTIPNAQVEIDGGRVTVDGVASEQRLDMRLSTRDLRLRRWMPRESRARARLDADLRATGTLARPNLDATATLDGRWARQALQSRFEARWPAAGPLSISAQGRAADTPLTARATLPATISLWPWQTNLGPNTPVQAQLNGAFPLEMLNPWLWARRQEAQGIAHLDATVGGTLGAPLPQGRVRLENAGYRHDTADICLENMSAALEADQRGFSLTSLLARSRGGGTAQGTARGGWQPADALQGNLSFSGFSPFCGMLMEGKASGNLGLAGQLQNHTLSGRLTLQPLALHLPGASADGPSIPAVPYRWAGSDDDAGLPVRTALDITLEVPPPFQVSGRGLTAEMEGDLRVTGTADDPQLAGALTSRRGSFNLLGQQLALSEAALQFAGPVEATRIAATMAKTVQGNALSLQLSGPLMTPTFTLASNPAMPDDEILGLLIFNRRIETLSPFQALRIAQALRVMSGAAGSDPGLLESARGLLGIDTLDVGQGEEGGVNVTTGKYLSDDVYLSITQGSQPGEQRVRTEWELTPSVFGHAEVGADSNQTFGLEWQRSY